ncbi:MoaD/ThiS family protein [Bacillus sp. SM2101]|uniref:MoaD/ThiS family protein n=1 Tax=Bacillus sp. SM2101 TaxID=2805366 RepID=UPI001BDDF803|nr:MoaD/ThiS family protein [Bacillus sp. SM2101]
MNVKVKFSGALAGQSSSIVWEVSEGNLQNVMTELKVKNLKLYNKITDGNDNIKAFVGVYLNGSKVEGEFQNIRIEPNDEVLFIGSVAGG